MIIVKKRILATLLSVSLTLSLNVVGFATEEDEVNTVEAFFESEVIENDLINNEEDLSEETVALEESVELVQNEQIMLMADVETVQYPIEKDETWSFQNISVLPQDITGLNNYIDYVIYYKDGSIQTYEMDSRPDKISVPTGGKIVITSTESTIKAVIADDYFIVEQEENPVFHKITLNIYDTCTFTNTSNVVYNILSYTWSNPCDYILYDTDGNVVDYRRDDYNEEIEVPAGYSLKITQVERTRTFNGLYEKFDLIKNDEPVMKKVTMSPGETYTYTNTSNVAYNILSYTWSNPCDYVLYYSNGKVKETVSDSYNEEIEVPAGGSLKITQTSRTRTFSGLDETFNLTNNNSSMLNYRITNTDTIDVTFKIKSGYSYSYAIYDADNVLFDYGVETTSNITIPKGGYALATVNTTSDKPFEDNDAVSTEVVEVPVYKITYLSPDETYKYTNTGTRELKVYNNGVSCDYVIHNADGSINTVPKCNGVSAV